MGPRPVGGIFAKSFGIWRPRRDPNPCCRRESSRCFLASLLLNSYLEAMQPEQQVIDETLEVSGPLVFPRKQRGFDS